MIKAVAFDLDNTLIDFSNFKKLTSINAARAMIDYGLNEDFARLYSKIWQTYDIKGIEYQKTFSDVLIEYKLDLNEFERIQQAAITAYLKTKFEVLRPYSDVLWVLLKIRSNGMKTGIITDAPRNKAWQRLVITGLDVAFDYVITFDDTKKTKPDAKPFELFLEKSNLNAHEVLFIGDNPERDVLGARKAGMITGLAKYGWQLNKDSLQKADYELDDIIDLFNVIEELNKK